MSKLGLDDGYKKLHSIWLPPAARSQSRHVNNGEWECRLYNSVYDAPSTTNKKLHNRNILSIKKIIYGAIEKHITSKPIPYASFTVDKVKSKVSGENFLGLRIFFLDSIGEFRSYNLSIKQFRPSSNLQKDLLSVILRTWLDYSFREFGLDRDKHMGESNRISSDSNRL